MVREDLGDCGNGTPPGLSQRGSSLRGTRLSKERTRTTLCQAEQREWVDHHGETVLLQLPLQLSRHDVQPSGAAFGFPRRDLTIVRHRQRDGLFERQ